MQGELAHAAGADAATGSEETQRLRSALERIAAIEDKLYGNDWEEIEEARTIARRALGHSGTAPEGALCVAGAACVLGDPEVLADGVQACVPAGHVLMPVEPDTELLMALARAAELEQSDPEDHRHDDGTDAARTIYKALIVAARTAGLPATGAAQQQRAPVSEETLLAIWNEIDAEDEKVLAFGFAVARNVAATLGALAAAPAADTRRLDWLESDGCTGVFKLGGKWYTRKDYGSPHRKASSLRAAIDAASAVPANFERRPAGSVMMSAHALCPTDMPHPKRMAWMADYFLHHYALGGVEACKPCAPPTQPAIPARIAASPWSSTGATKCRGTTPASLRACSAPIAAWGTPWTGRELPPIAWRLPREHRKMADQRPYQPAQIRDPQREREQQKKWPGKDIPWRTPEGKDLVAVPDEERRPSRTRHSGQRSAGSSSCQQRGCSRISGLGGTHAD